MAFYAGRVILAPGDGEPDASSCSPTATTSTTSSSAHSRAAASCCARRRCRPQTARTCARSSPVASGGVVFTTIQKFFPEEKGDRHPVLSDRRNIVVIADEAHRSQYDFIDGFARHMRDALPNASFIGFTGTPIEQTDANTARCSATTSASTTSSARSTDGATVPIYYESRLAKLELDEAERPKIDPEFEEVDRGRGGRAQGEAQDASGRSSRRWSAPRSGSSSSPRDLVEHFENAARGDGRQGDGRLHEPAHLRRPVPRDRRAAAGVARRRRRRRARSRS